MTQILANGVLQRRYEKKYKVETSWVDCLIFRKWGEEARIEALLKGRWRAIVMKDQRTPEEVEEEVTVSMRSYRPEYVGEEDPDRDEEAFIEEALQHQDEYLAEREY